MKIVADTSGCDIISRKMCACDDWRKKVEKRKNRLILSISANPYLTNKENYYNLLHLYIYKWNKTQEKYI